MGVLRIGALLQPRIMLLEGIAVDGVVRRPRPKLDPTAVGRVDITESIEDAFVDQIEWNLSGRIKIVSPEQQSEPYRDAV